MTATFMNLESAREIQKPNFPDNLKKTKQNKTKTIPKNSLLFKSKYDFKNKM